MSVRFSTLDRRRLRELKPGEKITEPGITVVRLADGDLRYSVAIMVDGERIYRVIGKASERVTRTQCEEFIAQKQTEARAGRLSLPKARKLALTVAAAARRYLQRLEESGGNNIPIKRRQLDIYLVPYFGAQRLDAITEFAVGKYKKQRLGAGAANATINRELATLSYLFYSAVDWKWLDRVPVRLGKHKLPEGDGRIIVLPDEACDRLMRAATAGADPDCWLFVAFGLNTAMRHTEILSARWDKLDLPNRRLFVQVKGGAWREQPITPRLADILARERKMREDREGWITPSPHADNGTGQRVRMDRAFDDAARRARSRTDYAARHAAHRDHQAGSGRGRYPDDSGISGHKTVAMVLRYVHARGQYIDQGIKAIGRGLPASLEDGQRNSGTPQNTITQELHTRRRKRLPKEEKRREIRGRFQRSAAAPDFWTVG
ncbi:MAG: tyrosine-type recombinase/integrase [Stellaceae bacterium]